MSRTDGWFVAVRALAAVTLLAFGLEASAQLPLEGPEVEDAPSPLRCLQVLGSGELAYPPGYDERGVDVVIRVRMTFRSAEEPPQTDVFFDGAGDPFRSLVLERIARYRLPCLTPGQGPVVASQEFAFVPRKEPPVRWAGVRDEGSSAEQARIARCVTGAGIVPTYPLSHADRVSRGTVFAQARFVAPDQAPEVTILFDGGSRRFARTVEETMANYRLPCMNASAPSITVSQTFNFVLEGDRASFLSDAPLVRFVAGLEDPAKGHPRFDFNTMGCPFDVRFMLRRPFLANGVGEIGERNPNRREFIEWLRDVRLKVPSSKVSVLIGSTMTISVPCAVLDLT